MFTKEKGKEKRWLPKTMDVRSFVIEGSGRLGKKRFLPHMRERLRSKDIEFHDGKQMHWLVS